MGRPETTHHAAAGQAGAFDRPARRRQGLGRWLGALAATLAHPLHGVRQQRRERRTAAALAELGDRPQPLTADAGEPGDDAPGRERRWRTLEELSGQWCWETDAEMRLRWVSAATPLVTVLGWQLDELLGRRREDLQALEPPPMGWESLNARMQRREPFRGVELRARSRRGDAWLWIALSGRPRHDADGRFVGYEGVGSDITERKLAHERLRGSEQRWALMAGLASDWYWETDAEHRLLPPEPASRRGAVERLERGDGRPRWELHAAAPAGSWAPHRADLDARRPFRSFEFPTQAADGSARWLAISGIPRFDGKGRFVGYHGVGRDISERVRAEALLRRDNESLQRAVAARTHELEQVNVDLDAFTRQLAHELRTPIGQVESIASMLAGRERFGDVERRLLAAQAEAARGMRETLDALLLLARSTVQAMPTETVDLSRLAEDAVAQLPAIERCAPVCWTIAPGLRVRGTAAALRIVLANLLGNAAKFTRDVRQPTVRLSASEDADGRLRLAVEDNGVGFDPAQAGLLFTPFSRLHAGDRFAGTGIGLTIVQRIVERHGGSVAAHGAPGCGARFEFTLAAAAAEPEVVAI